MNECYYIGKRRTKRKRRTLLWLCVLLLLLALLLNACLYPQIMALVESHVTTRLSTLSAERIALILSKEAVTYDSLIHISYGTDGEVRSVSVDTVKMALLKQTLALSLLSGLEQEGELAVTVPVGDLFGFLPFSGTGRTLSISIRTADSLRASFSSSFTEAGINQTRHTLSFRFEITVYCFLAGRTETVSFVSSFPAAETIIVGKVPDSLTQISRLTDGITEYDIDDAVDFGNVLD